MGFVQFPGHDNIPEKSSPGVAQHLEHVYKEYILLFDNAYIAFVLKRRYQQDLQTLTGARPDQHPPVSQTVSQSPVARTPGHMQKLMVFANHSAAELRDRGFPEDMIQYIETHRPLLQRAALDQQNFRGMVAKNLQPAEQAGNPSGSFPTPQQQTLPNPMLQPGAQPMPQMLQQGSSAGPSGENGLVRPATTASNGNLAHAPNIRSVRPTEEQLRQSQMWIRQVKENLMANSTRPSSFPIVLPANFL
jgi:hypothetical protein